MSLKQQIDADLKTAMLAGDKILTMTLRGLKSAILDAEIAKRVRDTGLSDEEVITLLQKEAKKRQESAVMYIQGNSQERADAELKEKEVITKYLPDQMDEAEIGSLVDQAIIDIGKDQANMGRIIGQVKQTSKGAADGAIIARIVKEKLQS